MPSLSRQGQGGAVVGIEGIYSCLLVDQESHHLDVALRARNHEGCTGITVIITGINQVMVLLDQRLDLVQVAPRGRLMEGVLDGIPIHRGRRHF